MFRFFFFLSNIFFKLDLPQVFKLLNIESRFPFFCLRFFRSSKHLYWKHQWQGLVSIDQRVFVKKYLDKVVVAEKWRKNNCVQLNQENNCNFYWKQQAKHWLKDSLQFVKKRNRRGGGSKTWQMVNTYSPAE